jgi:hypothetical protein
MIINQTSTLTASLHDVLFDENASSGDLITIVGALAFFWAVVFTFLSSILRPLVYKKPWLRAAGGERYWAGEGQKMAKDIGMETTKDEFIDNYMLVMWPWHVGVYLQHLVGAILCIPSLLEIGDESTRSGLACLGIMSEMGWEVQDMVSWMYTRYMLPNGKVVSPIVVSFQFPNWFRSPL